MELVYTVKRMPKKTIVDVLFGDGTTQEVLVSEGPGFWARVVDQVRKTYPDVTPSDFSPAVEGCYYTYRRQELKNDAEKQERLGFFECPQCELVYPKHEFQHTNPCDNCRREGKE